MHAPTTKKICRTCHNERVIRDPFGPGLIPCPSCNADPQAAKVTRLTAERDRLLEQLDAITHALGDALADRDAESMFADDDSEVDLSEICGDAREPW